ncbi:anthranilate synthase component II [Candidatus Latescibacterota bacterium]
MILVIDNYDSFTYNLVQYMGELGADLQVFRNDKISIDEIIDKKPDKILISPGPCTPDEAGISLNVVHEFSGKFPLLGVCLGHQSIGQAFGGKIIRAPKIRHGKTSEIFHDGRIIYKNVSSPFTATRYHSLIVERESLPDCFEVSAWTEDEDNLIMGIRHKSHPTEGVQFHPESILTAEGKKILDNFIHL